MANGCYISDFGKLQYVHVTIDTFSGFLVATALTGEATKNVINHCVHSFSTLGVPNQIKADNGTGYCSSSFETSVDNLISPVLLGLLIILKDKALWNGPMKL